MRALEKVATPCRRRCGCRQYQYRQLILLRGSSKVIDRSRLTSTPTPGNASIARLRYIQPTSTCSMIYLNRQTITTTTALLLKLAPRLATAQSGNGLIKQSAANVCPNKQDGVLFDKEEGLTKGHLRMYPNRCTLRVHNISSVFRRGEGLEARTRRPSVLDFIAGCPVRLSRCAIYVRHDMSHP